MLGCIPKRPWALVLLTLCQKKTVRDIFVVTASLISILTDCIKVLRCDGVGNLTLIVVSVSS